MIHTIPPSQYNNIILDNPKHKEHIVITDGFYYRSGYWIETECGDGYFYPDADMPFDFYFWAATDQESFIDHTR